MEEALELVHRQLGNDFVILESREIPKRRYLPWSSTIQEVEISAEERPQHVFTQQPAANRTIRSLAETTSNPLRHRGSALFAPLPDLPTELPEPNQLPQMISKAPGQDSGRQNSNGANSVDGISAIAEAASSNYRKDFESLQLLVSQLERQTRPAGMNDVPHELFQYYHKLTIADVEDEIARDLIGRLSRQVSPEMLDSPVAVNAALTALIERDMRCAPPVTPLPGRREIVTLIGPTGAGKTTTLAKLAGYYHLKEGLRVGLVTVDSYRVGAIEQLQTYADILQLPLRTAANAEELRIALSELDDVDLILIDTAGRSPFDSSKMDDLHEIVRVSASNHVLLVMSLLTGPKMLSRIASQFATANPTSLVLTKIDEIPSAGSLMSVAREISCPVSYLTTGQDVPDQIEPAHPVRMARLILGRDTIHPQSSTC